jgi:aspartyl-tRNA(Asn)/glutamyl-tRNA(Gln) amidotransferase subunit C
MQLSSEEVEMIAELARLKLSAAELEHYGLQLSAILEHFAHLQNLDTTDIPPAPFVLPPRGHLREDHPRPGLTSAELFQNAPATRDNQFLVPPVLE